MATRSGSTNTAATKVCSTCGEEKKLSRSYFISSNPLHKDNRSPMCKDCIRKACYDEDGKFELSLFQSILRQLDKPYLQDYWESAYDEFAKGMDEQSEKFYDGVIGKYMKLLALPQNRKLKWDDSVFQTSKSVSGSARRKSDTFTEKVYYLNDDKFDVKEDMIRLFGEGYTSKEYQTMQRIYDDTKQDYPNISSNQKNLLLRYVRFAAKEEIATSSGIISEAEKWSKLATEALKQLNSIDVQGGVTCFSEFFQKFERVKDVTRILPRFKYRPNDAPDFIIWCYINYCRRLEGKPEVEYADVYKFYDDKVAEYVKQYGDPYKIFTDDPTLNNREKIKEFIELPPDYYDGEE